MTFASLSIRAAQCLAAGMVESFSERAGYRFPALDQFIDYLWSVASSLDLAEWDRRGAALAITGLGDSLPDEITRDLEDGAKGRLARICDLAREISASQIYAAWEPSKVKALLVSLGSEMDQQILDRPVVEIFDSHSPHNDGWGSPVDEVTVERWRRLVKKELKT